MPKRRPVDEPPGPRIIAADPLWDLVEKLEEEARTARRLRDERFAIVQEESAKRIRAAIEAAAELQDVSTAEAAAFLRIEPASVAAACRRQRIAGARKISGEWRIPVRTLERGRAA